MRGFSKAIVAGNLTRDPELRTTPNGASVCGFTVAVNRVYRDAGGEQREDVSFIDCSAWGKLGEMIARTTHKGSGVLVSGRLAQHSWEDKVDGKRRSRVEIVVDEFNFAGGNPGYANGDSPYSIPDETVIEDDDDEIAPETDGVAIPAADDMPVPTAEDIAIPAAEGEIELGEIPF